MRQPLGRGLDAILGGNTVLGDGRVAPQVETLALGSAGDQKGKPLLVPVERILAGRGQPRRKFADEQLDELASSIRENGILQPLVVVATSGGYELIAGERRLRAAIRAGLETVPVVIREVESVRVGELCQDALIKLPTDTLQNDLLIDGRRRQLAQRGAE